MEYFPVAIIWLIHDYLYTIIVIPYNSEVIVAQRFR